MELQVGLTYTIKTYRNQHFEGIVAKIEHGFIVLFCTDTEEDHLIKITDIENFRKVDHTPTQGTTISKFSTVLLDPPWNERGAGKIKRGADKHYPIMKTPDIIRTIIQSSHWNDIAENAHMYMWVTNNFLVDGLHVMQSLGFTYKTNFVWVKDKMGLGQYFRGQHEICLFGTKGSQPTAPRTDDKSISSVLMSERGKHSAKPTSSYELIERRSHGPYLEIFARMNREGWTSWGNEV